ncbi:MAG: hypothetical protein HC906_11485 [Bacteroidales bacterium]|nr:hypothetical protein [Bacteroidales bacterium]
MERIIREIEKCRFDEVVSSFKQHFCRISKNDYLEKIKAIQNHILRGDVFEINFCQEFFIPDLVIHPETIYHHLNRISPAPFSCLFRFNDKYLISASPERYLKKSGNAIISQPMKGTIRRNELPDEDKNLLNKLKNDPKEVSENIMIVDLVRNDLSKIAADKSVVVDELCGIYSYKNVHQMVSTIKQSWQRVLTLLMPLLQVFLWDQ